MANVNYLFIKNIASTVPESFVYEKMRDDFRNIVHQCSITERLSTEEVEQPSADSVGLIPAAYNLIVEALADPNLLKRLQDNAHLFGYWFFNVFIIPQEFEAPVSIQNIPNTEITKDITKGFEKFDLSNPTSATR